MVVGRGRGRDADVVVLEVNNGLDSHMVTTKVIMVITVMAVIMVMIMIVLTMMILVVAVLVMMVPEMIIAIAIHVKYHIALNFSTLEHVTSVKTAVLGMKCPSNTSMIKSGTLLP